MENKITAWIARDKNGTINIFRTKPSRFGGMELRYLGEHFCSATPDYYWGEFKTGSRQIDIPENLFQEIKWEDKEPTKVELTIKICNCDGEETPKCDDVEEVPTGDGSIVFLRHKKHEFKPFDKVLVRNCEHWEWEPAIFSKKDGIMYVTTGGIYWNYCIPYEGNEHLVGTTNNPK